MTKSPLLTVRVSVDYPNKPGVLNDLSLEIDPGEIVGLVGQSGSGKSTLALAILNLLSLKGGTVRGEVIFRGENLLPQNEKQLRSVRGRDISIVLQSPLTSLNPALRIGTQLREAWRAHADSSPEQALVAIKNSLESVSLPSDREFLRRRPSEMSVGQAQRVVIAMAILHRPSLLIADEATSALDIITQAEILNLFSQLNRDLLMAILYISHDLLSVASLCHRIAILHEGRIVECAVPQEIFSSPQHPYTRALVAALPIDAIRTFGAYGTTPREEEHLPQNVLS